MIQHPLKILIVDDEPESRRLLSILLSEIAGTKVVGEADSVASAKRLVYKHLPDIVLLDIQMPGKTGFDLVAELRNSSLEVKIIFVTAFDEYAIRAIKVSAFDYLLKPVGLPELEEALGRFRSLERKNGGNGNLDMLLNQFGIRKNIKVNTRSGYILLDPSEIVCCQADGNYTEIFLASGKREIITCRIGEFFHRLNGNSFFRISRSAVINCAFLRRVDTKSRTCHMKHYDQPLPVSRDLMKDLEVFCQA